MVGFAETDDGTDLTYRHSPATLAELERLVAAAERICCAVDGVGWELVAGSGRVTVRVTISAELRQSDEAAVIAAVLTGRF